MDKSLIKPMEYYASIKELVNKGAEKYGDAAAYRFKRKKEIVSKSFIDFKNDTMAYCRFGRKQL